jgi:hypothetical protein
MPGREQSIEGWREFAHAVEKAKAAYVARFGRLGKAGKLQIADFRLQIGSFQSAICNLKSEILA